MCPWINQLKIPKSKAGSGVPSGGPFPGSFIPSLSYHRKSADLEFFHGKLIHLSEVNGCGFMLTKFGKSTIFLEEVIGSESLLQNRPKLRY